MKAYKEIKPEFTVDKFTDGQAPTANNNSFQKMVNMIPSKGQMATRLGISELPHTPETLPWSPENGGDENARCVAVLNFETAQFGYNTVVSAQENPLFGHMACPNYSGSSTRSTESMAGSYSLDVTDNTASQTGIGNPRREYGLQQYTAGSSGPYDTPNPPDWWPGSGTACSAWLMTTWIKPHYLTPAAHTIVLFGSEGTPSIQWYTGNQWIYVDWRQESGGLRQMIQSNNYLVAGQWQFIACWNDWKNRKQGMYYFNDTTKQEWWNYYNSITGTHFREHSTKNAIGVDPIYEAAGDGYRANDSPGLALYDYMTFWDKFYTTNSSNVTLCKRIKDIHAS